MKIPIIMVAFGTTSKAIATYRHIEKITKKYFKNHTFFWSFSSRIIAKRLQLEGMKDVQSPAERFAHLAKLGYKSAIVQPLHLFAGKEFDSLSKSMQKAELNLIPGTPLIISPQDYIEICQILQPLVTTTQKKATLVIGHGTDHPIWTAYYCLETFLRQQFGPHIFVGTVDKYPSSEHLVEQICDAGYEEVHIIPFFLVTGVHYERDITGDGEASWQSRFKKKDMTVKTVEHGLGLLPGFSNIIIRHIEEAITRSNL